MRRINYYLGLVLMMVIAVACNEEFDTPPMVIPTASHTANMTIKDFKTKYWQSGRNFIDTCKEETYIHGWVTSSDAAGNVYKYIYIQDSTGGIGISIDASSLTTDYRVGQEIVLNMKDRWIGKYNGQYLIGLPEWYAAQSVWEAGRLSKEQFKEMVEINGLPDVAKAAPTVCKISDFQGKSDDLTQLEYQGRLIKLQNVKWEGADGVTPYSEASASTNRTITDEEGNQLTVVNSNYATFRAAPLPLGSGDVVGILYLTGADQWKLVIRDTNDCIGFTTDTKGTAVDPYTVEEAIANQNTERSGWVTGYIVGAVAPEVSKVSSNTDIEWKAPTTLDNTLVIGPSADCKDFTKCLVIALPQGTKFREQANLKTNEAVYQSQIYVKGKLETYMGTHGITGNTGSTAEYKLTVATGGVTELFEGFEDNAIPSDWLNLQVAGDKNWFTKEFSGNVYASMSGYKGTAPFDSWLITPAIDIKNAPNKTLSFRTQVNGYGSTTTKFEVYIMSSDDPTAATLVKLDAKLPTAPASGYSEWVNSGDIDLSQYDGSYYIGFRYTATTDSEYATWCVDDVKFGEGGGGDKPIDPVSGIRADLETMTATSYYGTYTSAAGWKAINSNVLTGGETDSNPTFKFIGLMAGSTDYAKAVTLNGKTSAVGSLTSPTISGGIGSLSFNYGMPYSDTKLSFRVDIKQNGTVVKSQTITNDSPVKFSVYSETVSGINIEGDFTVEITNLSPTAQDANKDRVCIWNITWDHYPAN